MNWINFTLFKDFVPWITWNCGCRSACLCNVVADPVVWCFIFYTQFWCKLENMMTACLWFSYAKMMLMGTGNHLLLCINRIWTSRLVNFLCYLTIYNCGQCNTSNEYKPYNSLVIYFKLPYFCSARHCVSESRAASIHIHSTSSEQSNDDQSWDVKFNYTSFRLGIKLNNDIQIQVNQHTSNLLN